MKQGTAVREWHAQHVCFKRLLERLRKEVDSFATGERPTYELMVDILRYLREFCDRVHHPREDAAFARLARRVPAPLRAFRELRRQIALES